MALWWYATSGHRLVDAELHPSVIRPFHMNFLVGPVVGSIVLITLIGLGIERLVNPLVLGYLMIFDYVLLGTLEAWEQHLEEDRGKERPRRIAHPRRAAKGLRARGRLRSSPAAISSS